MFKNIFKWCILAEFELICLNIHKRKSPWMTVVGWKLAGLLWTQGLSAWEMALSDECPDLLKHPGQTLPTCPVEIAMQSKDAHTWVSIKSSNHCVTKIFWKLEDIQLYCVHKKITRKTFWGQFFYTNHLKCCFLYLHLFFNLLFLAYFSKYTHYYSTLYDLYLNINIGGYVLLFYFYFFSKLRS